MLCMLSSAGLGNQLQLTNFRMVWSPFVLFFGYVFPNPTKPNLLRTHQLSHGKIQINCVELHLLASVPV